MKNVTANVRYWIAGTLVALAGVALARLLAPLFDGIVRPSVTVVGQLLALFGLFIICLGVRRRIQQTADPQEPASPSIP